MGWINIPKDRRLDHCPSFISVGVLQGPDKKWRKERMDLFDLQYQGTNHHFREVSAETVPSHPQGNTEGE